jgi:hypothetical protein
MRDKRVDVWTVPGTEQLFSEYQFCTTWRKLLLFLVSSLEIKFKFCHVPAE